MKHLLILISFLLLSSPVIGNNHKGETLYLWKTSSGEVWKGFGDKNIHHVYKGNVVNGVPNGVGILTSPNGSKYIGKFKDGKPNGQGKEIRTDGKNYVGEFKDGLRDGQGTYNLSNGKKFVGEWKNDKINGQGTMTFPNGSKYVGGWKDHKFHSQGTFTWSDGSKVEGEFREGRPWNLTEYDMFGNIIGKYENEIGRAHV